MDRLSRECNEILPTPVGGGSLLGLVSNLVSMAVLILSQFFMAYHNVAYGLLLGTMAALEIGFGTTLTAIQTQRGRVLSW